MELVDLLNIKTALCKECKVPCSSKHLQLQHNIQVPENQELLQIMKKKAEKLNNKVKGKQKRELHEDLGNLLKKEIDKIIPLLQDKS